MADDDLHQAIQAAAVLRELAKPLPVNAAILLETETASLLAGADALEQLQATRDRAHSLQVEVKDLQHRLATSDDRHADLEARNAAGADQVTALIGTVKYWEDRHADLEVYAAELAASSLPNPITHYRGRFVNLTNLTKWTDELDDIPDYLLREYGELVSEIERIVALQVDGPARGHAILDEVERYKVQLDEYEHLRKLIVERLELNPATRPAKVAKAVLDALDRAAQREVDEPVTQADIDLVRQATSTDLTGTEMLPAFDEVEDDP